VQCAQVARVRTRMGKTWDLHAFGDPEVQTWRAVALPPRALLAEAGSLQRRRQANFDIRLGCLSVLD